MTEAEFKRKTQTLMRRASRARAKIVGARSPDAKGKLLEEIRDAERDIDRLRVAHRSAQLADGA